MKLIDFRQNKTSEYVLRVYDKSKNYIELNTFLFENIPKNSWVSPLVLARLLTSHNTNKTLTKLKKL